MTAAAQAASPSTAPAISPDYVGPTSTNTYTPLAARTKGSATSPAASLRVKPLSDALRTEFDVPAFYTKSLVIRGMPVIGSPKVSDWAFLEAAYVLDHMLVDSPEWVKSSLTKAKVKVGIISVVEYTMDLPENQTRRNKVPKEAAFQDRRSRGLGGIPLASCGEENLLNLHGDPYKAEDITIHEFSHVVASAMQQVDPHWYERLVATYHHAMGTGLFAHSYSATNEQEYWAEGAQAWFDCAAPTKDASVHSGIWTRAQLKAYDPDLAKLLTEAYGDGAWRYVRADNRPLKADGETITRSAEDMAHLAGLDRNQMPTFDFEKSPRIRAYAASSQPKSSTN